MSEISRTLNGAMLNKSKFIWLFLFFFSIFVYFLGLHPVSGFLGGMVFFAIGWALPTLSVLSLSMFLVSFISCFGVLNRIFFVLIISIILSLLPSYRFFQQLNQKPNVEILVYDKLHIRGKTNGEKYSLNWIGPMVKLKYMGSATVGGNEGCMCMYFNSPKTFEEEIYEILDPPWERRSESTNISINVYSKVEGDSLCLDLEVMNSGKISSKMTIKKLSRDYVISRTNYGKISNLNDEGFFNETWSMFISETLWLRVLNDFFPDKLEVAARDFFSKSVF